MREDSLGSQMSKPQLLKRKWSEDMTQNVRMARERKSAKADVPQPRVGEICRKVSFWRTIVLRSLAALRPSTASEMKAIAM